MSFNQNTRRSHFQKLITRDYLNFCSDAFMTDLQNGGSRSNKLFITIWLQPFAMSEAFSLGLYQSISISWPLAGNSYWIGSYNLSPQYGCNLSPGLCLSLVGYYMPLASHDHCNHGNLSPGLLISLVGYYIPLVYHDHWQEAFTRPCKAENLCNVDVGIFVYNVYICHHKICYTR